MPDILTNLTQMFADEKDFPMLSRAVRANGRTLGTDAATQARLDVITLGVKRMTPQFR